MKKDKVHGDAYEAVRYLYAQAPGRSWQRLNTALWGVLMAAITAKLSFAEDDFAAIYNNMNGGYWMGNSIGSTCGEAFYSHAVEIGHTPACISFEKYANRPAALWPEKTKTPERLCVGSEFTWDGLSVKVTNMKPEYLIACSYKKDPDEIVYRKKLEVGQVRDIDDTPRRLEDLVSLDDGAVVIRLSPSLQRVGYQRDKPDRVFKIPYEELKKRRREYDQARKAILAEIEAATNPQELEAVSAKVQAAGRTGYRHFDIEDFNEAYFKKTETFKKADVERLQKLNDEDRLKKWLAGENVGAFFAGHVRLRVKGRYLETSTGQSVSLESVKRLLPLIPRYRKHIGPVEGYRVDLHPVHETNNDGVTIGCTLVPWPEIERLPQMMEAAQ